VNERSKFEVGNQRGTLLYDKESRWIVWKRSAKNPNRWVIFSKFQ